MKRASGFTVIELAIVIVVLLVGTFIFLSQKADIEASARDKDRKTAINAMYYNLEEVYHQKNGHYPEQISSDILTAMNPDLFTDPEGDTFNSPDSDYYYDSQNCNLDGECKSYTLHSSMEREAVYEKTSRPSQTK